MNAMQKRIHRDAEVHIPLKKERIIVVNVRNGKQPEVIVIFEQRVSAPCRLLLHPLARVKPGEH
jgi:hypothetical protein